MKLLSENANGGKMNNQFEKIALGKIKPQGWLKRQLEIQANGLTGHIEEAWEQLCDNGWKGGSGESWERGPYYLDGLVPLAYILNDQRLIDKAKVWIDWILESQDETGNFGPKSIVTVNIDLDKNKDWWHYMLVLKVLTQYYEATEDQRVLPFMNQFFKYMYADIQKYPLEGWARARGAELILCLSWFRKHINEPYLESLTHIIIEQTANWTDLFDHFPFWRKVENWHWNSHVVNVAMGIKLPGVLHECVADSSKKEIIFKGINSLMTYHGQAHGMFSGDEWLSGTSPNQGVELCAVVEYMYAMEELIRIYGDGRFGDILEKVTFNALPGTIAYDWCSHQYDQQVNQISCHRAERPWSNGPDANMFGLEPHFGCCAANMHQGWPKFVAHAMMKTEKGYAINTYAPTQVTLEDVTISVVTDYPFRNEVLIDIYSSEEKSIYFRIPEWCENFELIINHKKMIYEEKNNYAVITKVWDDQVKIDFNMTPKQTYRGCSTTFEMGPLVFVLPIEEKWQIVRERKRFNDYEVRPLSKWQYGAVKDSSIKTMYGPLNHQVFSESPVTLKVKGHYLLDWGMKDNNAEDPKYYHDVETVEEELTLVPYACTKLRVGEMPVVHRGIQKK